MILLRALVGGYLRSNALRAAITFVAITLGVALAFAIDVANDTAIASFSQSVDLVANHVNLQVTGSGRGFDEHALLRVQSSPGVLSASPIIEGELAVGVRSADFQSGELLHVLGVDITRQVLPAAISTTAGSFDVGQFINGNGIIVSDRVAREYRLRSGSVLQGFAGARSVRLYVAHVIPPGAQADSSVAFADIATAQQVFSRVGRLDRIDCIVQSSKLRSVAAALKRVLPADARVIEPRVRTAELQSLLRSFQLNLTALAYVALLVATYLIYNAVAISVVQRRAEIGTLRALGARRADIFRVFLIEGLLFGLAGSFAGLLLGALLAQFSVAAVSQTVSTLFAGTHADAAVYRPSSALVAFAAGVVLAALSAVAPALQAAGTAPARMMRSSALFEQRATGGTRIVTLAGIALLAAAAVAARLPPVRGLPVFGYVAAVAAIGGASLLTPALFALFLRPLAYTAAIAGTATELAVRAMTASRGRFAVAIASLMVAVAMMVAIAVMVGSFRATVVAWANQTLGADLYIGTPGASDASYQGYFRASDVARLARVRGVAAIDTYRGFSIPLLGHIVQLGSTDFDPATLPRKMRFIGRVDLRSLIAAMNAGDNVIVSDPFVNRFGLRPGDRLTVPTPSGIRSFRILAQYNDYSTSEGTFIISRPTFERLFADDTVDAIAVYAQPGMRLAQLRSQLLRAAAPLRITVTTNRELRAYVVQIFNRTFAITSALYVISIAIAVLGVVSTLTALVLERRTEIALLRYLGLRRAQVRGMIFVQAGVVGLVAGIAGVILGMILALLLIDVINLQSFGWLIETRWPWVFFLEAIGLVVVAALVAALVPSNIAATIKTAEALRAE
ncbi:MAG TPA: FtsX-like permease family protein [Candidatus Baltobacteraceae bacterium]|jgi:putative ABC transport system permease protein|nr:FtsX-like permease family protein [Candidatus Baltobacteraceae bacterium]